MFVEGDAKNRVVTSLRVWEAWHFPLLLEQSNVHTASEQCFSH